MRVIMSTVAPILEITKLRVQRVKGLSQSHAGSDFDPDSLITETPFLIHLLQRLDICLKGKKATYPIGGNDYLNYPGE